MANDTLPFERFTEEQKTAADGQIEGQTKRIDSYITEYSIEVLAKKMREGEFEVPEYQREFTWEEERKWRFIESLLMTLPVPYLFFWENPATGKLEIVDGSQRLRTIEEFVLGGLELGELDRLDAVSGFRFDDLPKPRQRKFLNRSIRGIILNANADDQARFDLFERINTGSKVANKAEIRRGSLKGPFMDLVIELAKTDVFVDLAPVPAKDVKLREREELVTRFFAYGDGLEDYADEVSPFLFQYSRKMNERFAADSSLPSQYRVRFERVMSFIKTAFPFGFRRSPRGSASPRARFEAISVGTFSALEQNPELDPNSCNVAAWIGGDEFKAITRADGANAIKLLRGRIDFVKGRLLGAA